MFQKAQRKQVKIKLAITGPSGSGKTFSALKLASGLGTKIAVIDTENGSASLYSEFFDFDVVELQPPFTPEKYIDAINAAEKANYDVLIIDSLSHEWEGEGGLLQQKETLDQRGGNSFTNWGKMTKPHNAFNSAYLHSSLHIIATMRSKQDYIIEANDKGKQTPRKVGLKPIQRDGTEYEFTTVFDVAMNHEACVSKDRTNLFTDKIFKITEQTGIDIKNWLSSAKPQTESQNVIPIKPQPEQTKFSNEQKRIIWQVVQDLTKNILLTYPKIDINKFQINIALHCEKEFFEKKIANISDIDFAKILKEKLKEYNEFYGKQTDDNLEKVS